jgi:hypothetical protein
MIAPNLNVRGAIVFGASGLRVHSVSYRDVHVSVAMSSLLNILIKSSLLNDLADPWIHPPRRAFVSPTSDIILNWHGHVEAH